MNKKNEIPLLSICIPTFNRSYYLEKTIKSIITQKIFIESDDIEIIISDNCSSDNTKQIIQKYINKFKTKIKYFRNNSNIQDKNFEKVLSYGNGLFLKLNNDTLSHVKNSLEYMIKIIKFYLKQKPVLFFSNFNRQENEIQECLNLNEFINSVSFYNTWIGSFGIWKEHFMSYNNFSEYSELQLTQTGVLFKLILENKQTIIINKPLFTSIIKRNKGGSYNIAKIFGKNYLTILKEFVNKNHISKKVYDKEKKNILLKHIIPYYFDFKNKYNFQKTGYMKYMKNYYKNFYFWLSFINIGLKSTKTVVKHFFSDLLLPERKINKKLWKKNNKHNKIRLINYKNINKNYMDKIFIGNYSYGFIDVRMWGSKNEQIIIGNFVSIANAKLICGGNHSFSNFSTFPYKVVFLGEKIEATSKGPIIIEDDVWIGTDVTILSGVTIGQGAVIAANSVITKDVESYSVVGGNPAKFIKYRFNEKIRKKLLELNFEELTEQKIIKNKDVLYQKLTDENIEEIFDNFNS